jgi:hypothetical protein
VLRRNDGDGRDRLRVGPFCNRGLVALPQQDPGCSGNGSDGGGCQSYPAQGSTQTCGRGLFLRSRMFSHEILPSSG